MMESDLERKLEEEGRELLRELLAVVSSLTAGTAE